MNPKALLLAFAIGCGGASADILDASDDGTLESSTDASSSSDAANDGSKVDAPAADVVANDASDASSEAAPTCTPLVDAAAKAPAVGCTCIDQLQGCTLANPGADCRWFVEKPGSSSCSTECLFYPVPDSGACAACAETYNCACAAPLFVALNPKCKCVDSDAGPYCEVQ